jgi:hypothetical protein
LKSFGKNEHIHVARRGNQPGVDWSIVEAYIARSRITRVDEALRPHPDPGRVVRGVALLDRVQSGFGWSDRQLARALGVTLAVVSPYGRAAFQTTRRAASAGCPGHPSKQQASHLRGNAVKRHDG